MRIVIIGSGGRLGAALTGEYQGRYDVVGLNRGQLDLSNLDGVHEKLRAMDFDVLINAAAFTNVDLCETERDRAFLINAEAPGILAKIASDKGAKLIHFSTDYVFDGEKRAPYTEEDQANPISAYGESKLAGEKNVLAAATAPTVGEADSFPGTATPSPAAKRTVRHLVVRVSWVFGPDRPSFIDGIIKRAKENEEVDAIADKFSAPTYTRDIAEMLPQFFDSDTAAGIGDPGGAAAVNMPRSTPAATTRAYGGILHFSNAGKCSWQEYGQWALECCRSAGVPLKARTVGALKLDDMTAWVARRPVYSVLSAAKYAGLTGTSPRTWRDAVADYITRFYSKK